MLFQTNDNCFRHCEIVGSQILLYDAQPCDAGGVLVVSSSPLEGELMGSSWHLCCRPYTLILMTFRYTLLYTVKKRIIASLRLSLMLRSKQQQASTLVLPTKLVMCENVFRKCTW